MRRSVPLLLLGIVLAACETHSIVEVGQPRANPDDLAVAIMDGTREGGNPGFFWLPPIASHSGAVEGEFDPTLLPFLTVAICEWDGTACVDDPIRTFTAEGEASEKLRVSDGDDVPHYIVNWHEKEDDLTLDAIYRIRVFAGPAELGYADVDVVQTLRDAARNPDYVALRDGQTLPIKFVITDAGVAVGGGVVSNRGGVVLIPDGSGALEVPAGAASGPITITINPVTTYPGLEQVVAGTVFDFGPDGVEFGNPVRFTIQYDVNNIPTGVSESDLRLHKLVGMAWFDVDGSAIDIALNTVTGMVTSFSVYAVVQAGGGRTPWKPCPVPGAPSGTPPRGEFRLRWRPPSSTANGYNVYDDQWMEVRNDASGGSCRLDAASTWVDTSGNPCNTPGNGSCTSFVIGYPNPPRVADDGLPVYPDSPLTDNLGNQFTARIHEWMHFYADMLGLPRPHDEAYLNFLADLIVKECASSPPMTWCSTGLAGIDFAADFAAISAFLQEKVGICSSSKGERTGLGLGSDPCPPSQPPSSPPGNSNGDVHIRTSDGLAYDFQGAGEYLFVASADGEVVVQVRQEPWGSSNVASVNTAVAMNVGGDRVAMYLGRTPDLYVNGQPNELVSGATLDLANGGRVYRLDVSSRTEYVVWWPNGFVTGAKIRNGYMDVGVSKPEGLQVSLAGLVGNLNGQASDDITSRDGITLSSPVLFDELYRIFGNSWRISDAESLFDYEPGTSTETFQLLNFPLRQVSTADFDQAVVDAARQSCEAAGIQDPTLLDDCILDLAVTGEQEFVESALGSESPTTPVGVVGLVNGGFDVNAEGWFWKNLDVAGGWLSTGNPGGSFALNQAGQLATDPRVCQVIQGLKADQSFRITGEYASYAPQFGDPAKTDAFAVTLNGAVVLALPRPSPVSTDWTAFSTEVITGVEDPTICFEAERDGDDSSFLVDNIALKGAQGTGFP